MVKICIDNQLSVKDSVMVYLIYTRYIDHKIYKLLHILVCIDNQLSVKDLVMIYLVYVRYIDYKMNKLLHILICSECLYVGVSVCM